MDDIKNIVGQNIRLFRKSKGMTQEQLAEKVNVSGSYIGYLERGKKSPSLILLEKIACILNVDPATLLTSNEEQINLELKKLIALLSDKRPEPIEFLNEVAVAYFKSLEAERRRIANNDVVV